MLHRMKFRIGKKSCGRVHVHETVTKLRLHSVPALPAQASRIGGHTHVLIMYLDGRCLGSAVGLSDPQPTRLRFEYIN